MKVGRQGEKQEAPEKWRGGAEKKEEAVEKHSEGRANGWRKKEGRACSKRSQKRYIRDFKKKQK